MPQDLAILLLAAGASSRMRGGDKLLEDISGRPLLTHLIREARATTLPVWVTLPALDHPRAAAASDARRVVVPDAAEGMAASIRRGVAALPATTQGVLLLPADMPELTCDSFLALADRFDGPEGPILRATGTDADGEIRPGHPVLFPHRCFAALTALRGDTGARAVLQGERVQLVPLPAAQALTDLDTPEAWSAWRHRQSQT
ncbi:nucleotidyltransferase family protein [Tritonibacter horizontis]|uniref:Molybdenum cofactor guanylyltransferase n=1 Tax=Tritonibacter horizontis TaxID=1768241 RepID=A0A132C083_9RHOB|nr:nucleotidyltransferase family protein [Tritonibacter horizontis]KUP93926.1 molybdenum cofactor guanylyltransferase [Tritonibacter horizontis]